MVSIRTLAPLALLVPALLATLSAPLPAQEIEEDRRTQILRLRAVDADLVKMLTVALGGDPSGVETPEQGMAEVSLLDDGTVKTGALLADMGDVHLEFHLRPDAYIQHHGEEYRAAARNVTQGLGTMLALQGAPAEEVKKVLDGIVELPGQFLACFVRVTGDPEKAGTDGLTVELDLVGRSKSDAYYWIRRLAHNNDGAPVLSRQDAMVSYRVSLAKPAVEGVLGPFVDTTTAMVPGEEELRARTHEQTYSFLDAWDGTLAGAFTAEGINETVVGLAKAEDHAANLADEDYLGWIEEIGSVGGAEIELKPGALVHRDVQALRTHVTGPALGGSVESTGYRAVAGGYEVALNGPGVTEEDMKAALDRVLDGEVTRSSVGERQVARVEVDLAEVRKMLPPGMLPPQAQAVLGNDDGPGKLILSLGKVGLTLKLKLELK